LVQAHPEAQRLITLSGIGLFFVSHFHCAVARNMVSLPAERDGAGAEKRRQGLFRIA
jgi:hypothetical protein